MLKGVYVLKRVSDGKFCLMENVMGTPVMVSENRGVDDTFDDIETILNPINEISHKTGDAVQLYFVMPSINSNSKVVQRLLDTTPFNPAEFYLLDEAEILRIKLIIEQYNQKFGS